MSTEIEQIGELTGPTAIDAVYTQEDDGRTYDLPERLILNIDDVADRAGDCFSEGSVVEFDAVVPVFPADTVGRKFGNVIGTASLYVKKRKLYADLFLLYSTPERLAIETGTKLYPTISGILVDKVEHSDGTKVLNRITVKEIILSLSPNADSRIPPL